MQYQQLQPFQNVVNGGKATCQVYSYDLTLGRVVLKFTGANSITKATISEIVVKVGARVVFGPISGAALDKINKYKGMFDQADSLTIDFTERDGLSVAAKEIGGIDIPSLRGEPIFVEVTNSAGAGTPGLRAIAGYTGRQFSPKGNTAAQNTQEQLIKKILRYNVPTSGGTRLSWMPNFRKAIVQRVHFEYTGTDWTALVNGNLHTVECKLNGVALWDRVQDVDNRFLQLEQRKAPQSRMYTLDFIADNVNSAALATSRVKTGLEFNLDLTAVDVITAYVECLDLPRNL